jgi:fatty-acyl-CoA synthase
LVNCSEPVRKYSHELFSKRYASYGLNPGCLGASYAMAENTFAVTQTLPGKEARSVLVHRESLLKGYVIPCGDEVVSRACVSSGRVIEGSECRVTGPDGKESPANTVGELAIRSRYMFSGYRNNDEATVASFHDGWFLTGDMGFIYDGEVYVVGRKKDLIIVAGKNIFPEDIEDITSNVSGVLKGRVVAFGIDNQEVGTEGIGIIAETAITDQAKKEKLKDTIVRECMEWDFTVSNVYLVPPRWLIKSSAGKLSRKLNIERLYKETIVPKPENGLDDQDQMR